MAIDEQFILRKSLLQEGIIKSHIGDFIVPHDIRMSVESRKTRRIANVDVLMASTTEKDISHMTVMDNPNNVMKFYNILTSQERKKFLGEIEIANIKVVDWTEGNYRLTAYLRTY